MIFEHKNINSRLAQLVERQTFNLVAVGSSPTAGAYASMPEWSKGAHLRCAVVHQRVGSNPTGCILVILNRLFPINSVG